MALIYKPISIILGLLGAQVAKAVFTRVWQPIDDEEAPKPTQEEQTWARVLTVAVIQGAVFQVVKATIQRSGAKAWAYLTGVWPGPKAPEPE